VTVEVGCWSKVEWVWRGAGGTGSRRGGEGAGERGGDGDRGV